MFVANGHLWDQNVPDVPGTFTGTQIHSGSYRNTDDLEGDRVLVVGAGNSGCDLAVDARAAPVSTSTSSSASGVHFQPKSYFGGPRQQVGVPGSSSPPDEQDLIARLLARVSIGQWKDYPGMPEPESRTLAEGRVVVNDLLLYWIQHGRIRVVPGISRFDGKTVHFADGAEREYDTILWATGLPPEPAVPRRVARPAPERGPAALRRRRRPAGLEKLYYIGLAAPRGPQIPVYGVQTKLAIRHGRAARGGRRGRRGDRGVPVRAPEARRPHRHRPRHLE